MRRVLFIFCAATIGLLGGCQQIAWKPGASAADLNRDTAACREQFAEELAVQNCLRQRGWVLRQPPAAKVADTETDADDTTAAAESNSTAPGSTPVPTASTTTSASTSAGASSATAASTPAASDQLASTPVKPAAAKPVAAKAKVIDPMAKTLIQSWWKVGAQAADLTADQDACVDMLGAAHRPDLQNRLYTHAMIDCLHAHGWSGH